MKKTCLALAVTLVLAVFSLTAQAATANGTLTVTATVNGSIHLVFNSDPSGVVLTGTGTPTATLAFGNVEAYGGCPTNVTCTPAANNFAVSTPVDVAVYEYNSASASYTLKAALGTTDATDTWSVAGTTITTTATQITATGAYTTTGTGTNYPVQITIPYTVANGTNISNTILYTATSN
jgi:hypothetical protein